MNTQTVTSGDVTIMVIEANIRQDTARARLRAEAFEVGTKDEEGKPKEPSEADLDRRALLLEYADLIPITLSAEGIPWPITIDQLAELPGALGGLWERAALNLNPHWYTVPAPKVSSKTPTDSTSG